MRTAARSFGGRPPNPDAKKPKSGKGSAVRALVTQELRDALDAEADRTGRSLSQVAELWLEDARRGHATAEALLGGKDAAPVLRRLADLATQVTEALGPPSESHVSRLIILKLWNELAETMLPQPMIDLRGSELFRVMLEAEHHLQSRGWPQDISGKVLSDFQDRVGSSRLVAAPCDVAVPSKIIAELYRKEDPGLYKELKDYFQAEAAYYAHMKGEEARLSQQLDVAQRILEQFRSRTPRLDLPE